MEGLRNCGVHLVSVVKALLSADARHLQMQLTALAIVFCILIGLIQIKQDIREALLELHQLIYTLEKTGSPGAAKAIPCASHPGKNCAAGVFGNAIAQMHGCCGSFSSVSNTGDSNPGRLKLRP